MLSITQSGDLACEADQRSTQQPHFFIFSFSALLTSPYYPVSGNNTTAWVIIACKCFPQSKTDIRIIQFQISPPHVPFPSHINVVLPTSFQSDVPKLQQHSLLSLIATFLSQSCNQDTHHKNLLKFIQLSSQVLEATLASTHRPYPVPVLTQLPRWRSPPFNF